MSTPLIERELMNVPRHRWTVGEFHRMAELGLLDEDSRVELIDGEVVEMAPIGSEHAGHNNHLLSLLAYRLYGKAVVAGQNPVVLGGYEEPQPDIALLRWREDYYRTSHPHAEDVLLIIEISDSTLHYDRDVKIPLYARNGIPEVWLLDIQNRQLDIYREPINGQYQQRDCRRTGQIAPILCPDAIIDLAELFPGSGT
ncbi:MAG: Uma2 family endonuclease [Candidatus Competibacter denitrificans]